MVKKSFKRYILVALLICWSCSLWIRPASAALVNIAFQGTITYTSPDAAGLVSPGELFYGVYAFDPNTPDTDSSTIVGQYTDAIKGLSFNVGNFSFTKGVDPNPNFQTDSITIVNNGFGNNIDLYGVGVFTLVGNPVGSYNADQFRFNSLYLTDGTGAAFSSDALPLSAPPLSAFVNSNPNSSTTVALERCVSGTCWTFASANLTTLVTVPIPSAAYLFLSGLLGLCGYFTNVKTKLKCLIAPR